MSQSLYWFVWEYLFWDTGTLVMSYSICSMKGENKILQGSCGKHKDKNEAGEGLPQWTLLHNSRAKALSNLERCYTGDFISKISKQLFEIFPWATKDSLTSVTRIFTHHNFLLRWFNFNRFFSASCLRSADPLFMRTMSRQRPALKFSYSLSI